MISNVFHLTALWQGTKMVKAWINARAQWRLVMQMCWGTCVSSATRPASELAPMSIGTVLVPGQSQFSAICSPCGSPSNRVLRDDRGRRNSGVGGKVGRSHIREGREGGRWDQWNSAPWNPESLWRTCSLIHRLQFCNSLRNSSWELVQKWVDPLWSYSA